MNFKVLIEFLSELSGNNNKEWFDLNRNRYEALRKDWIIYIDSLLKEIVKFDPSLAGLDSKKCIFRINKDVRFSKDKSPYKSNFGAILNREGKKSLFSGYYLHIDPKEIFIAAGAYQPSPELLSSLRQEIDYNLIEFKAIVEDKNAIKLFGSLKGEKLVKIPKGYEMENPASDYLKHKSFIWVQNLSVKDLNSSTFNSRILESFSEMKPLNDFINRCIS